MKIDNKNLLIGAGVVIVGYLLWKKSKKDELNKRVQNLTKFVDDSTKFRGEMGMKPNLGMPQVTSDPDFELLGQVAKLPNEFVVKSNGYDTRYYKDKIFSGVNYKQSFRTDGLIGGVAPIKISNSEFLDAYSVFLKQPK